MTPDDRVYPQSADATLSQAIAALDRGEVIAIPTDTVYGLAARIDRAEGVAGLFRAKGRPSARPIPVLVADAAQAGQHADFTPSSVEALAKRWWPGPLTLVVSDRGALGERLGASGSVGLRCPDQDFVRELCREAGPLAVTSANPHGEPPGTKAHEVVAMFAKDMVGLIVDGGHCDGVPSTVVDCMVTPPTCVREGGVSWENILDTLS